MNVNDLFTLIHFHLFQLDVIWWFHLHVSCFSWLNAQFMNTRLVMMSASLHTQTVLHCLIIQVLHTRVCFCNIQYTSLTSVHSNLEHGLVILTESFSPLRSVLHNHDVSSTSQYNLEHRLAIMSNKLSLLSNSTSALLEFQIWSDTTSHATLFTCHVQQLVRTGLRWTMSSLCGIVALNDLCWNFLFSCQMICKQYIVLNHMFFRYESNLEPITLKGPIRRDVDSTLITNLIQVSCSL